ncbi:MAG: hypothetical protein JSR59_14690 [Proteobacteria bacterium]|nr:hypothetical protein [Pseudomonadota bacterium]
MLARAQRAIGRRWARAVARRALMAGWLGLCAALPAAAYDVPKLNTVYHFVTSEYPVFGNFELSPLVEASDGNFYGVSAYGGVHSNGYVYKVSPSTGQLTHIHDFQFRDGMTPRGALIQARDGYLYGTTESGGRHQSDYCYAGKFYNGSGCGTLFRVGLDGSFQKVHDFYSAADGYQTSPNTGVVQGRDGNLYGMAVRAFPSATTSMFKVAHDGKVSVFRLFAEDLSEGYLANGGLIRGRDGNLYGTTSSNGAANGSPSGGCGTVFKAGTDGSFETLHVFSGSASGLGDGCFPTTKLLQGSDGGLYGTTQFGGYQTGRCLAGGCGMVFRIDASTGDETVLHRFAATSLDGEYPQNDGLAQTPDGTLYGTTGGNPYGDGAGFVPLCRVGGSTSFSCGTIYRIDTQGKFKQLVDFGKSDGAYGLFPHASLVLGSDGNLYGNTFSGGGYGLGTVYRLVLDPATPIVSIDGLEPASGGAGTPFSVIGIGYTGATQLTIGNGTIPMPIPFSVVSDSQIDAVVPEGAVSSAIGVTTPRGTTFSPMVFSVGPDLMAGHAALHDMRCARTPARDAQAAAGCGAAPAAAAPRASPDDRHSSRSQSSRGSAPPSATMSRSPLGA